MQREEQDSWRWGTAPARTLHHTHPLLQGCRDRLGPLPLPSSAPPSPTAGGEQHRRWELQLRFWGPGLVGSQQGGERRHAHGSCPREERRRRRRRGCSYTSVLQDGVIGLVDVLGHLWCSAFQGQLRGESRRGRGSWHFAPYQRATSPEAQSPACCSVPRGSFSACL